MERKPLADKINTPQRGGFIELDSPDPSPHKHARTPSRGSTGHPTTRDIELKPTATPSARLSTTTPKKRAVPQDEVHARNLVLHPEPCSPSPKRVRHALRDATSSSDRRPNATQEHAHGHTATSNSSLPQEKGGRSARPSPAKKGAPTTQKLANTVQARPKGSKTPGAVTTGTTVVTTTRIDKSSRISEQDRQARLAQQQEEANVWRVKFRRAFPNFVFYLDSYDVATRASVVRAVESLGARVEPFFSRQVTHLVTTRNVPALPVAPAEADTVMKNDRGEAKLGFKNQANIGTSTNMAKVEKGTWAALPQSIEAARRAKKDSTALVPATGSSKRHGDATKMGPIHSDRNPFDEPGPPAAPNDIVYKAKGFGMKVWHHSKLTTILNMLLGDQSTTVNQAAKEDLGVLLEREKVEGTTERDPNAPRADYYYFPTKVVHYVLVEDATGEHRPIMIQEYEKPKDSFSARRPPWPKLYGEVEGRCPFTWYDPSKHGRMDRKPTAEKTLRRALSMNQIGDAAATALHDGGSARPALYGDAGWALTHGGSAVLEQSQGERATAAYQMASGNSVTITSNIASTAQGSTNSFSLGSYGAAMGNGYGPAAGLGTNAAGPLPYGSSALAQLSRRTQTIRSPLGVGPEPGNAHAPDAIRTSLGDAHSPKLTESQASNVAASSKAPAATRYSFTADGAETEAAVAGLGIASGATSQSISGSTERQVMGPPLLPSERKVAMQGGQVKSATPPLLQVTPDTSAPAPTIPAYDRIVEGDASRRLPTGVAGIRRSVSISEGLRVRARPPMAVPAKLAQRAADKEKKPGYCENCRLKFDDIDEHARSKKHLRFATNAANFADIDELVLRCQSDCE